MIRQILKLSLAVALSFAVSGCSSFLNRNSASNNELAKAVADLEVKTSALEKRQNEIDGDQSSVNSANSNTDISSSTEAVEQTTQSSATTVTTSINSTTESGSSANPVIPGITDLPANPQPGECYAHIWSEPQYKSVSEEALIQAEQEIIEVIPAQYETVMETVEIRPASTKVEPVSATYTTATEQVEIKPADRSWYISSRSDSPKASANLLSEAELTGFNLLSNATNDACYHEHYYPGQYQQYSEQILIKEASERIEVVPARYGIVNKQVLVEAEQQRSVSVPAVYDDITESIIDSPARDEWQQCGGASGNLNQVMCFVHIPETYKTVTQKVLRSPATTRNETVPAKYLSISVQDTIEEAREIKITEPAEYAVVTKEREVAPPRFIWHEIHGGIESPVTRTGRAICYRETPAQYKSVNKSVQVTAATTRTINIPAVHRQVPVQKIKVPEQTQTTLLPAKYETIIRDELIKSGRMEWRAILCEANYRPEIIEQLQQSLNKYGFTVNKVDGKFGPETLESLNRFQKTNSLPVDRFINIQTLNLLGITAR